MSERAGSATPGVSPARSSAQLCPVCFCAPDAGEVCALQPCGHIMCSPCCTQWARTCRCAVPGVPPECAHCSAGRVECPVCRAPTTRPADSLGDKSRRAMERAQRHALREARRGRPAAQVRDAPPLHPHAAAALAQPPAPAAYRYLPTYRGTSYPAAAWGWPPAPAPPPAPPPPPAQRQPPAPQQRAHHPPPGPAAARRPEPAAARHPEPQPPEPAAAQRSHSSADALRQAPPAGGHLERRRPDPRAAAQRAGGSRSVTLRLTKDLGGCIGVRFKGCEVTHVTTGTPAEQGGVRPGMLIAAIEGRAVDDDSDEVFRAMRGAPSSFALSIIVPAERRDPPQRPPPPPPQQQQQRQRTDGCRAPQREQPQQAVPPDQLPRPQRREQARPAEDRGRDHPAEQHGPARPAEDRRRVRIPQDVPDGGAQRRSHSAPADAGAARDRAPQRGDRAPPRPPPQGHAGAPEGQQPRGPAAWPRLPPEHHLPAVWPHAALAAPVPVHTRYGYRAPPGAMRYPRMGPGPGFAPFMP
eukprot:TRINITY_DN12248_c1_g1_i1.p1 TRINITY_DN12248_c1_g1~~TRINITY_DN12248_c1_g1_i1.p1  ORF type:complete len:546 (+),score=112.10 TRINITY_DN12248_c1_g1_i1:65-1639(+)